MSILKINVGEEASLEFTLRKIDETKHNDLISEKYKETFKYLNYVELLLILASTVTGCISISAFASLLCVLVGITSSVVALNFCAVTAGIKKYEPIKKEEKAW